MRFRWGMISALAAQNLFINTIPDTLLVSGNNYSLKKDQLEWITNRLEQFRPKPVAL